MFPLRSAFGSRHLLLAALLLFGSEVVLWTTPTARSPFDWALLVAGYLALSLFLLEVAAFYRARNLFDLMALAGVYGLLNALLLNPASALIDVPRTLITRAMGAHSLIGLAMLGFFLWVSGRRRAPLVVFAVAALAGAAWGVWGHWSPLEFATGGETSLAAMLATALVPLIVAGVALARTPHPSPAQSEPDAGASRAAPLRDHHDAAFSASEARTFGEGVKALARMTRLDWAITLAAGVTLLVVRLAEGAVDSFALVTIPMLIVYCVAVLYFQKRKKGAMLLDALTRGRPSLALYAAAAVALLLGGLLGYGLPRGSDSNDLLAVIAVVFTGYGLVWLPAVSLVLGARAFVRQARALRL